ncbi:MAG: AmmeMemoRadiSam system protein A [Planctomycetaceae bacterium]|nr:AmmeMemoRadiSam system protein A [Planctomycetaceae bacterium]
MALGDTERRVVGEIVTASLAAAVAGQFYEPADPGLPALDERCGCFVTLKTNGQLRGCLGCFVSDNPLWQTVADYARYSALCDPRFTRNRLTQRDLPEVEIEVSVLSPLEPCHDPLSIIPGIHGIYVKRGPQSGCYLPQVATEMGWGGVEEFWTSCCRDKAGMSPDAWQQPGTECSTFTADVFEVG